MGNKLTPAEQYELPVVLQTAKQLVGLTAAQQQDLIHQFNTACEAKRYWIKARNTFAFNIPSAKRVNSNQHGRTYHFTDGSWLSVSHSSNNMQYGPKRGVAYGECRLWSDRKSWPMRTRLGRAQPEHPYTQQGHTFDEILNKQGTKP